MGLFWGTLRALRETQVAAQVAYLRTIKRGTFRFQGKTYPYFYRRYNRTLDNERIVEVPIVWDEVKRHAPARVLEVGNVLTHYFPIKHEVVDKYEQASGVIHADVVDYEPGRRYDLIATISTLEHVGWDEEPRDPEKFLRAVEHLATLLAPGGTLLVTLPLGYNPEVDRFLADGRVPFTSVGYLKRDSRDNVWHEASWSEVAGTAYVHRQPKSLRRWVPNTAQAVVVGRLVSA
jgi:SAM-dependent methyltransferase